MASANAEIGVARAAFYPNLSLNAMFGTTDSGFNIVSLPNRMWSVGAAISQPLFYGRSAAGGASVRQVVLAQTRDQYRSTVLAAFQQVEDQLSLNDGWADRC